VLQRTDPNAPQVIVFERKTDDSLGGIYYEVQQ
jgi:hypothetical protein